GSVLVHAGDHRRGDKVPGGALGGHAVDQFQVEDVDPGGRGRDVVAAGGRHGEPGERDVGGRTVGGEALDEGAVLRVERQLAVRAGAGAERVGVQDCWPEGGERNGAPLRGPTTVQLEALG